MAEPQSRSEPSLASRETYEQLERSTPEQRTEIVLKLIEEHPRGRLELPPLADMVANLQGVDLSPESLRARYGPRLRSNPPPWWDREFRCARLVRASLRGANLFHANLSHALLQYADLRQARLWLADLEGALLLGADLSDASLMAANLFRSSLVGASLAGTGLRNTNLREANLEYADLKGANAWRANLQSAYLRDACLQGVDLSTADLAQVHISGALLDGTLLSCQQFHGPIGEEVDGDFNWARFGYQTLRRNFMRLGDEDAADWAQHQERRALRLQARAQRQWGRLLAAQLADALRDGRDWGASLIRGLLYGADARSVPATSHQPAPAYNGAGSHSQGQTGSGST